MTNITKLTLLITSFTTLLASCSVNENSTQTDSLSINLDAAGSSQLDSLFHVIDQRDEFMGSIALVHQGEIIYTNVTGFDDIETQKKSTNDSKYRIGSISKTFTAALIFKAIEDGHLKLEQSIEDIFPQIENADKITIRNLLNHSSGIHSFTNDKRFIDYHTTHKSTQEMLEIIAGYPSDFEPNSNTQYSNSNYVLLTLILEKVYQSSFKDLLTEKICIPLHLTSTYYGRKIDLSDNESNSYKYMTSWIKQTETDMSIPMGAGSLVSNAGDLASFIFALFNEKVISKEHLEHMKTITGGYGMGLMRFNLNDRECFGHNGSIDGFKSVALYFPDDELAIVLLSNGAKDNKEEILTKTLTLYFNDDVIDITTDEVKTYAGQYTSPTENTDQFIFLANNNVLTLEIQGEFLEPLTYKGNRRFVFEQVYAESMSFTFSEDAIQLTVHQGDYEGIFMKE